MSHEPFSLKYRPRSLSQLIGQDVLVQTMTNAITKGRVHHAFLFVGPHGTGKTSAARVLAASLNCEEGETVEPCGKCGNCQAVFAGRSADVIELDAASNRGVDDIRDIKKDVAYRPVSSRYKVYIIDEAHALTKDAVEALLKTLEEPPRGVKFVLCTTERHKVKDTILSRCQDFVFQSVPWPVIAKHLKKVCEVESIGADEEGLKLIAKHARGHVRDALQGLERVSGYVGDGMITAESAQQSLGLVSDEVYFNFVEAVIGRHVALGYQAVQKMLVTGADIESVLDGMLNHLRNLMAIGTCEDTSGVIKLSEEEKKRYVIQKQLISIDVIDDMVSNLVNVYRGLYYNVSPQTLMEQFLFKAIRAHHRASAKQGG